VTLQKRFPDAFESLESLFGEREVREREQRLDDIFDTAGRAWTRNLANLGDRRVKYLLFAEAPPWSDPGLPVSYFYESLSGAWVKRVLKACLQELPTVKEDVLRRLADKGFPLIDSLPFAMRYTTAHRKRYEYLNLVATCKGYLEEKLKNGSITWSNDVKVGLGFKWNGLRLIEAFGDGLRIRNNNPIPLTESQIAADGSGYTSASRLKEIWGI